MGAEEEVEEVDNLEKAVAVAVAVAEAVTVAVAVLMATAVLGCCGGRKQ